MYSFISGYKILAVSIGSSGTGDRCHEFGSNWKTINDENQRSGQKKKIDVISV